MTEAPPRPPADLPPELDPRRGAEHPGRLRRGASRALVALAAVLSAAVFLVSLGGYTAYRYFDGQISRIRLELGGDRPADPGTGSTTFLMAGSDSRAGTGSEFSSGGEVDGERSDTTILAHLDANGATTLISFPRDTLVRIPGHGRGKLNSAITFGGPSLLIRTIENLTDIRVDHYVSVDLEGFRQMTNAIGGVTVCLRPLPDGSRANLRDPWSQWSGVIGANHLNGEQALAFVRQRHGLPDGDFDRIHRQQQFISAVFARATSSGVLANPVRLDALLRAATGALTVDDGTTMDDLRRLASRLRGMSASQIHFETIPVHAPTPAEGANALGVLPVFGSVQIYDPRTLAAFLAPLRGEPNPADSPSRSPGSGAASGPVTSPRSAIRVDVHNGAGISGLAGTAAAQLATAGFRVGPARTWGPGLVTASQVRYPPSRAADARAVAAVVPGATIVADQTVPVGSVTLVLGTAYSGIEANAEPPATAGPTHGGSASAGPTVGAGGGGTTAPSTPARPAETAAELTASCTY